MVRIIFLVLLFCSFAFSQVDEVDKLILEAQTQLQAGRAIDARETLLDAIKKYPDNHRPQFSLGNYYLYQVRNFRLAYKYIKNAKRLLIKKYGSDYNEYPSRVFDEYRFILLTEIDCISDLDDYQEALRLIEEFETNFFDLGLIATKSWLLMKEGELEKSYKEAQKGVFLSGGFDTRSLNVLGIVQSIRGERQKAIRTFDEMIELLNSQGLVSQLSTPLNNVGEVYRETFQVDKAEESWSKILAMPDACDHVLPSLNLAHLYIDQLRLFQAEQIINSYESCFKSDGLRDDTEHRILIKVVRAKLNQRMGNLDEAEKLLLEAKGANQWFGKIGTTVTDMKLSINATLSNLYLAQSNWSLLDPEQSVPEAAYNYIAYRLGAYWYARQAISIAVNDLNQFEDLYVRNTDSMLEYPTLGRWLSLVSSSAITGLLDNWIDKDERIEAKGYYRLYKAENGLLGKEELLKLYEGWPENDAFGKAEALALLIREVDQEDLSRRLRVKLFSMSPAHFKEFGYRLPAVLEGVSELSWVEKFSASPYRLELGEQARLFEGERILLIENSYSVEELADKVFSHHRDYQVK